MLREAMPDGNHEPTSPEVVKYIGKNQYLCKNFKNIFGKGRLVGSVG